MTDFNPFLEHFEQVILPQMAQSSVVVAILTDHLDSMISLQVGAAVLLDKPIIVLTRHRSLISSQLAKIVTKVVVMPEGHWNTAEAAALIQAAITEMTPR